MPDVDLALVAKQLAAKFLENGNYAFAGPLSGTALGGLSTAAASVSDVDAYSENSAFAGLSVQSVGYEHDRHDDIAPKIHVYVVKGSRKAEQELADSASAVPIEIDRIGRVVVRPEAAAGTTNKGNIFEHNGRLACGSSCAPLWRNLCGHSWRTRPKEFSPLRSLQQSCNRCLQPHSGRDADFGPSQHGRAIWFARTYGNLPSFRDLRAA